MWFRKRKYASILYSDVSGLADIHWTLLTAEDFWFFLRSLPTIHNSHQSLEQMHWFEAIFEMNWLQNFEVAASKFNIDHPLTSMASKTALPYISKIVSNQLICSKDWWKLWIVGRDRKKTKSPQQWGVKKVVLCREISCSLLRMMIGRNLILKWCVKNQT